MMKIFIMFGTQDKSFSRFFEVLKKSKFIHENEVIIQSGYTEGQIEGVYIQNYFSEQEIQEHINSADIIITHAGIGSIINCLKQKKRIIVVPRLAKYKEQSNDHQLQIMEKYSSQGYIYPVYNLIEIDEAVEAILDFQPKEYCSDKQQILNEITMFINDVI